MRIFDETKTRELQHGALDFEKGYLKNDKKFLRHHEAVEAKDAVYKERIVTENNGFTSTYMDLVSPAVEAKEAYDEYENIQVYVPYTEEELKQRLRTRRGSECFPYINRGGLWYDTLSAEQHAELEVWYKAWLNVTETLEVPRTPNWLK